jgi:3-hydroxybutyryl-CoA dehydrogenase
VAESLEIKRELFSTLERWLDPGTIVVSNTSSLPLSELAPSLCAAGRFAGLHFLYPAHLTRVVELVPLPPTSSGTLGSLYALIAAMKKRAILVRRPVPGYIWNRLQMALIRECAGLIQSGIADLETVDAVIAEGLAPRWLAAGPLATADLGGISTFYAVARQLFPLLSADAEPNSFFARAREVGGFYDWNVDDRATLDRVREIGLRLGRAVAVERPQPIPLSQQNS